MIQRGLADIGTFCSLMQNVDVTVANGGGGRGGRGGRGGGSRPKRAGKGRQEG